MRIFIEVREEAHLQKLLRFLKEKGMRISDNPQLTVRADGKAIRLELDEKDKEQRELIAQIYQETSKDKENFNFSSADVRNAFLANHLPEGIVGKEWLRINSEYEKALGELNEDVTLIKAIFKQLDEKIIHYDIPTLLHWFEQNGMQQLTSYNSLKASFEKVSKLEGSLNKFCMSSITFNAYLHMLATSPQASLSSIRIMTALGLSPDSSTLHQRSQMAASSSDTPKKEEILIVSTVKIGKMEHYAQAAPYLFHGIGGDVTKLTLISRHGIKVAADASGELQHLFVQHHGQNEFSSSGGTNKDDKLSTSSFDSESFHRYNKGALSFMIHRDKVSERTTDLARGVVVGEVHITGSIAIDQISGLYVPRSMLNMQVKDCVALGVLEGSSTSVIKIQGFLNRVEHLLNYSDKGAQAKLLQLAAELDSLYNNPPRENTLEARSAHQGKIDGLKQAIEKQIGEYYHQALGEKPLTIKEYLQDKALNSFKPIVFMDSVYVKPQPVQVELSQQSPNPMKADKY